ncbi:MAG: hypothetical protein GVX90_03285, partial [Alphaproteobacteria bacterium]|nr:hypothetical protein [Alphaproteobacteria bacterium]
MKTGARIRAFINNLSHLVGMPDAHGTARAAWCAAYCARLEQGIAANCKTPAARRLRRLRRLPSGDRGTRRRVMRHWDMDENVPPVLIVNSASGSYSEQAVADVRAALGHGDGAHVSTFDCRTDGLPDRAALEEAGARRVAIFAGDGTISRHLVRLEAEGWGGAVLPLPGGTQNLLA